jgi:hypothetical protein
VTQSFAHAAAATVVSHHYRVGIHLIRQICGQLVQLRLSVGVENERLETCVMDGFEDQASASRSGHAADHENRTRRRIRKTDVLLDRHTDFVEAFIGHERGGRGVRVLSPCFEVKRHFRGAA